MTLTNILKNSPGPFSTYILNHSRSDNSKKMKNNNNMSAKTPNIKLVDNSDDEEIVVNQSNNIDDVNLILDSDDESVDTAINENITPVKTKKSKMPIIEQDEFKFFSNNMKQKPIITREEKAYKSDSESESEIESSDSDSEEEEEEKKENIKSSPKLSSREMEKKKQEILIKLISLEKKGIALTKNYSLKSSLEELEFEYETQRYSAEIDASVKFQQKILMAGITGIEFLNKKFDPLGAKLEGWSESVMDNITDYEEIFKKLHEKYQERASMPPELQLLVTLVGSGFMFHLTNTLFKSSLPGLGDALKNNPDIMK